MLQEKAQSDLNLNQAEGNAKSENTNTKKTKERMIAILSIVTIVSMCIFAVSSVYYILSNRKSNKYKLKQKKDDNDNITSLDMYIDNDNTKMNSTRTDCNHYDEIVVADGKYQYSNNKSTNKMSDVVIIDNCNIVHDNNNTNTGDGSSIGVSSQYDYTLGTKDNKFLSWISLSSSSMSTT